MRSFGRTWPALGRSPMTNGRIAILVPCFNGGSLLAETIAAAATARLPADAYAWMVSDNASDDGSIEGLPSTDSNGAPVIVRRNPTNLGRVENWNCALAVAEELGFSFALFLMVGDALHDDGVLHLRTRMDRAGAVLGLGSYEVVDMALQPLYTARRLVWHGDPETGMAPR